MDLQSVDATASVWMKRGIALLEDGSRKALEEAIECFDRAIDIRRGLPLDERPEFNFGVAAGLLNRADALTRLGGDDRLDEAVATFDEALRHLSLLTLDQDPRVRRRVAIAWQNRGLALSAYREPRDAEARRSFQEAIAILDDERASAIADRAEVRAVVGTNLAAAWLTAEDADANRRAIDEAHRALGLLGPGWEKTDRAAAEVALKARHVICQAIARELGNPDLSPDERSELVNAATDAVDEGLVIARHWEQQGIDTFRPLAFDLVRFGMRVYRLYQPHFLDEFVLENLDPDQSSGAYVGSPEMRAARLEALWLSFRRG